MLLETAEIFVIFTFRWYNYTNLSSQLNMFNVCKIHLKSRLVKDRSMREHGTKGSRLTLELIEGSFVKDVIRI